MEGFWPRGPIAYSLVYFEGGRGKGGKGEIKNCNRVQQKQEQKKNEK